MRVDINEPGKILEMLSISEQNNSGIKLVPYHLIRSNDTGLRTYFEC
jgi:hypothetical protein